MDGDRRRLTGVVVGLVAAAAGLVVVTGALGISRDDGSQRPSAPSPTPSPTERPSAVAEWPGPIRTGASLPVVSDERLGPPGNPWRAWSDPVDSAVGQIDITLLAGWGLQLRDDSRLEAWLTRQRGIVEYGIVVDTDGDRVADCQLAVSNDAAGRGSFRVLLQNVHTGKRDERRGPPYGYPFEFGFPNQDGPSAAVFFEFLGAWQRPCQPPQGRLHWYAYSSLTEGGRVTAWDFAPDDAWLRTLPHLAVEFGGLLGRTGWGADLELTRER